MARSRRVGDEERALDGMGRLIDTMAGEANIPWIYIG